MTSPELVILAGPNGAGKTTFARNNLETLIEQQAFLNADDIAREVNPSNVEAVAIEAGRAAIARRAEFVLRRRDFCIETTLATRTLLRFIHMASVAGYRTSLIFLFTPLPYLNELRVKQRVMSGGHNIETDTIRRRHKIDWSCWQAIGTRWMTQSYSMRERGSRSKLSAKRRPASVSTIGSGTAC